MKIHVQTVDMKTGAVTETKTIEAQILPVLTGHCQECGRMHSPDEPHDAQSLHYQYTFYERESRWPTWDDAMAHCSDEVRTAWIQELVKHGIASVGKQGGAAWNTD